MVANNEQATLYIPQYIPTESTLATVIKSHLAKSLRVCKNNYDGYTFRETLLAKGKFDNFGKIIKPI